MMDGYLNWILYGENQGYRYLLSVELDIVVLSIGKYDIQWHYLSKYGGQIDWQSAVSILEVDSNSLTLSQTSPCFYVFAVRKSLLQTLWEKEKLLVNKPLFLRVSSKSLLQTLWEKEKLLVTSNFSFSRSVFYSFEKLYAFFIKFEIVVCKLSQFGRV